MTNPSDEISISQSYRNLPPKHKGYLWALIAVAVWSQALIILGLMATFATPDPHSTTILESYQSLPPNRENLQLKEEIAALEAQIHEES